MNSTPELHSKSGFLSTHNIQAPRYTSYPTVPYWDNEFSEAVWKQKLSAAFKQYKEEGISLYLHLPFCESLCTYCACNTRITVNHAVEEPYINSLLKEWDLYLTVFGEAPKLKELHLGGGTPTFFSPANLKKLLTSILSKSSIAKEHNFSFEGHPSNTTEEHLEVLSQLGFNRVSFGVQDFDEKVQDAINRYQTYQEVENAVLSARKHGYISVNVDLVYGLPHQTQNSVLDTVQKVIALKPERIAFYSYAHVPWLKPGQRKYSEKDLPGDAEKRSLYENGKVLLLNAGYIDVGMDHFALPGDALFEAYQSKKLHRNFMGYTEQHTRLLIGLGASSISDCLDAFAQNIKSVEAYQKAIEENSFPVFKGHVLTAEDLKIRLHILDLMCRYETTFPANAKPTVLEKEISERLQSFFNYAWLDQKNTTLKVTEEGRNYLRNICLAFDQRYWQKLPEKEIFSTTA